MKKYRNLTKKEEEQALISIINVLLDDSLPYSGEHRKKQWQKGWGENVKSNDLTPKYFGKYPINRLKGKFIMATDKSYEQQALYTLVDSLAHKYLRTSEYVAEFGCGTGHNLLRIRDINPEATLIGLDWVKASQRIVNSLGEEIFGEQFDFFNPPKWLLPEHTAVYTVAALEQTGTNYKKFVKYLLKNKPSIVVHIEPIPELLDPSKLLDYLSIKYMEKRKYLSGYLDYLRTLEKEKKIKILEARRSGIGSYLIDGYSIVVWKPI